MKLFSRKRQTFSMMLGMVLLSLVIAACGNSGGGGGTPPSNASTSGKGKGCPKVGVLLPETATSERWEGKDKPLLSQSIQTVTSQPVDYYNAQGDATKQQNQADEALTKGDCILVVAASDLNAAAAIVSKAKAQSVPVIAYDRLIQSKDLSYYVSFDNMRVGELQGQYIADHYQSYVKGNDKNVVMINGSQIDNIASLFRQGALNKLQPLYNWKGACHRPRRHRCWYSKHHHVRPGHDCVQEHRSGSTGHGCSCQSHP